jgi:UDP-2,4-diacetamido-2,4,6-trideoxy-beta-L-altropyranose hydrolase
VALRIAMRVDASTRIGLGHVKRCLSLAHALRERGAQVSFVARALGVDVAAMAAADGFSATMLPAPEPGDVLPADPVAHAPWAETGWHADARQTVAALGALDVDWLVVDHYAFDARWHTAVRDGLGCRIAAIDDLADRAMAVDVLIDHNHADDHRRKYEGRLPGHAVLLGGPRFALLGPAYATAARHVFQPQVHSIGIFMGGADAGNFSARALEGCRQAGGFDGPVEIATTTSNPHLEDLEAAARRDGRTTLSVNLPELSGFFARHDLQIGASGGATWERCCIGAPTLGLIVADNQKQVLLPLSRLGVVHALPSVRPDAASIGREVRLLIDNVGLRHQLSQRAAALVDGLGARRAAAQLIDA